MENSESENHITSVDILSFDGGGSKGIMEASILNDVMRLATILLQDPTKIVYVTNGGENVLSDAKIRKRLSDHLKNESNPIHPTEVYEMIVGTSTGALIAFGLVGGNEDEDGKRKPMSLEEIIEMYLEKSKEIFAKSWSKWFASWIPGLGKTPITTYPQDNVGRVLMERFGDCTLSDFREIDGRKCVAGAVARQIGKNEQLVLFDTRSEDYMFYKVRQVLLATSNAPVYFDTPVKIGDKSFVDGGVGGNCPLAQAIPRAKKLFGPPGKVQITSALSVAPPRPEPSEVPRYFQIKYWLNYFVEQSTDGYAVYKQALLEKDKDTLFERLAPRGESLKKFKLDEVNVQGMLNAITNEKLNNEMFLVDVICSATVIVYTSISKSKRHPETAKAAARLAYITGSIYYCKEEYEFAINSYETSIKLWEVDGKQENANVISENYNKIANCLQKQGNYRRAIKLYESMIKFFKQRGSGSDNEHLVKTLNDLADCFIEIFQYHNAEEVLNELLQMMEDSQALGTTYGLIAWCEQEQGNLEKAYQFYTTALDLHSQGEDLEKAETLNNLGLCFADLHMYQNAMAHLKASSQIRQRLGHSLKIAESSNNLGWCFMRREKYDDAEKYLREAHKMMVNENETILVAVILENLGECLSHTNKYKDATEYVQQALASKKAILGDFDNPAVAKSLYIAGTCFLEDGKLDKAREFLYKSYRMTMRLSRSNIHPNLENLYTSLSKLHAKQGNTKSMEHYKTRAETIRANVIQMRENVQQLISKSGEPPKSP